MKLDSKKRIAASLFGVGKKRIRFDPERLDEIKEAITKSDIRSLVKEGVIRKINKKGVSRGRARHTLMQKRKGRRRESGSIKGTQSARFSRKKEWINRVRAQRQLVKLLKNNKILTPYNYRLLRKKIKGGFFRSRRHVRLFIEEYNLAKKNDK